MGFAFSVGILGNATGIDHVHISRLGKTHLLKALAAKIASNGAGLRKIEFTTQGMKCYSAHCLPENGRQR
jgi:6-phosphogluconolactonase (cycloisomerase 2 family)